MSERIIGYLNRHVEIDDQKISDPVVDEGDTDGPSAPNRFLSQLDFVERGIQNDTTEEELNVDFHEVKEEEGENLIVDEGLKELIEYYEQEEKEEKERSFIKLWNEPEEEISSSSSGITEGERRYLSCLADVPVIARLLGLDLTAQQWLFITAGMQAFARKIYGLDWERCKRAFELKYKINSLKQWVAIMAPRRYGKTIAVSILLTVILIHCPKLKLHIFSTKKDTGSLIIQNISNALQLYFDEYSKARIVTDKSDMIVLCSKEYAQEKQRNRKLDPNCSSIKALQKMAKG